VSNSLIVLLVKSKKVFEQIIKCPSSVNRASDLISYRFIVFKIDEEIQQVTVKKLGSQTWNDSVNPVVYLKIY
jgi:hypothetical protein